VRDFNPALDRCGVKGGGPEYARVRSAYPPKLSVKADIPARQPSANSGHERVQQTEQAYSITSFACASKLGGKVTPIALAVGRLMTNSNSVGCTTGMSDGFSPLRMRPV
jgi:hypothetical protein